MTLDPEAMSQAVINCTKLRTREKWVLLKVARAVLGRIFRGVRQCRCYWVCRELAQMWDPMKGSPRPWHKPHAIVPIMQRRLRPSKVQLFAPY